MEKYTATFDTTPDNKAEISLEQQVIDLIKKGIRDHSFAGLSELYNSEGADQDRLYTAILGSLKQVDEASQSYLIHDQEYISLLREIGVPEIVLSEVFPNLKTQGELDQLSTAA